MKGCGTLALVILAGIGLLFGSCAVFVAKVQSDVQAKRKAEDALLTPEQREERDRNKKLSDENYKKGLTAMVDVKKYILSKLKSPSTAKIDLGAKESQDHSLIFVTGTVDSQNSFGAMLRSNVNVVIDAKTMKQISFDWQQP